MRPGGPSLEGYDDADATTVRRRPLCGTESGANRLTSCNHLTLLIYFRRPPARSPWPTLSLSSLAICQPAGGPAPGKLILSAPMGSRPTGPAERTEPLGGHLARARYIGTDLCPSVCRWRRPEPARGRLHSRADAKSGPRISSTDLVAGSLARKNGHLFTCSPRLTSRRPDGQTGPIRACPRISPGADETETP